MAGDENFVLKYALDIDLSQTRTEVNKLLADIDSVSLDAPSVPALPAFEIPAGVDVVAAAAKELAAASVIYRENIEAGLRALGATPQAARSSELVLGQPGAPGIPNPSLAAQQRILAQGRESIIASGAVPAEQLGAELARFEQLFKNAQSQGFGQITTLANKTGLPREEVVPAYTAETIRSTEESNAEYAAAKKASAAAAKAQATADAKAARDAEANTPEALLAKNAQAASNALQSKLAQLQQAEITTPENLKPTGNVIDDKASTQVADQQIKEEIDRRASILRGQNAQLEAERVSGLSPEAAAEEAAIQQKSLDAMGADYAARRAYAIQVGAAEQKAFNDLLSHDTKLQELYGEEEATRQATTGLLQASTAKAFEANPALREQVVQGSVSTATEGAAQEKDIQGILAADSIYIANRAAAAISIETRTAAENVQIQASLAANGDYIANRSAAAISTKTRTAQEDAQTQGALVANEDYIASLTQSAIAQKIIAADVAKNSATSLASNDLYIQSQALASAAQKQTAAQVEAQSNTALLSNSKYVEAKTDAAVSQKIINAQIAAAANSELAASELYIKAKTEAALTAASLAATEKIALANALENDPIVRTKILSGAVVDTKSDSSQNANLQRVLAADEDYIATEAAGTASLKQKNASISGGAAKILAADDDYIKTEIQTAADNATLAAKIAAGKAGILATDQAYIAAQVAETVSITETQAQIAAQKNTQLAANDAYIAAIAIGSAAQKQISAAAEAQSTQRLLADDQYKASKVEATVAQKTLTAQIQAASEQELAASSAYIEAKTDAAVAAAATAAAEKIALAKVYAEDPLLSAQLRAGTVAERVSTSGQNAQIQEQLVNTPEYITSESNLLVSNQKLNALKNTEAALSDEVIQAKAQEIVALKVSNAKIQSEAAARTTPEDRQVIAQGTADTTFSKQSQELANAQALQGVDAEGQAAYAQYLTERTSAAALSTKQEVDLAAATAEGKAAVVLSAEGLTQFAAASKLLGDGSTVFAESNEALDREILAKKAQTLLAQQYTKLSDVTAASAPEIITTTAETNARAKVNADLLAQETAELGLSKEAVDAKVERLTTENQLAATTSAALASDTDYLASSQAAAIAKSEQALALALANGDPLVIAAQVELDAQLSVNKAALAKAALEPEALALKAQEVLQQRLYNEALAAQVKVAETEAGLADTGLLARIQAARGGSGGNGANATSSGDFFAGGALSTIRYAAPAAALFGAVAGIKASVSEAEKLEVVYSKVQSQLQDTFGDKATALFSQFKNNTESISAATGIAQDQVAELGRQLQASFGQGVTIKGVSGEALVGQQQDYAAKLSKLFNIDPTEAADNVTAIGKAYNVTAEDVGNLVIKLEDLTGVPALTTFQGIADIGPAAKEAGFSLNEIATLLAVVNQRSGVSGSTIADAFGRALPYITKNQQALRDLAAQNDQLNNSKFLTAVDTGNAKDVLFDIGKAYQSLNAQGKNAVDQIFGSPKTAVAFASAFSGFKDIDAVLKDTGNDAGLVDKRFAAVINTITGQLSKLKVQLLQVGQDIYNGGLKNALDGIIGGLHLLADALGLVFNLFGKLNSGLGHIPGDFIEIVAEGAVLVKTLQALQSLIVLLGGERITLGIAGGLGLPGAIESATGIGTLKGSVASSVAAKTTTTAVTTTTTAVTTDVAEETAAAAAGGGVLAKLLSLFGKGSTNTAGIKASTAETDAAIAGVGTTAKTTEAITTESFAEIALAAEALAAKIEASKAASSIGPWGGGVTPTGFAAVPPVASEAAPAAENLAEDVAPAAAVNTVARGGILSGVTRFATSDIGAVAIPALTTYLLYQHWQSWAADRQKKFASSLQDMSEKDLKNTVNALQKGGIFGGDGSFGDKFQAGLDSLGGRGDEQLRAAQDALLRKEDQGGKTQLGKFTSIGENGSAALLKSIGDINQKRDGDLSKSIAENFYGDDSSQISPELKKILRPSVTGAKFGDSGVVATKLGNLDQGQVEKIIKLATDPKNPDAGARSLLTQLVNSASVDPKVVKEIETALNLTQQQAKDAKTSRDLQLHETDITALQDKYNAGSIGITDYLKGLTSQIKDEENLLKLDPNDDDVLKALTDHKKQVSDVIVAANKAKGDLQKSVDEASGASTQQLATDSINVDISTLSNPQVTDPSDLATAATDVLTNRKAILDQMVSQATSDQQAAEILSKGVPIPPIEQAGIAKATLANSPEYQQFLSDYKKYSSKNIDSVLQDLYQQYYLGNETIQQAKQAIGNEINQYIQSFIKTAGPLGSVSLFSDPAFQTLLSEASNFGTSQDPTGAGDIPGTLKGSADDIAANNKAALNDAYDAQSTLYQALYANDPVKLAQYNQQRAVQDYGRATDAAGRIKAIAAKISADQSLKQALDAIAEAKDELAVAISGNNPFAKAQADQNKANEDLKRAVENGDTLGAINAYKEGVEAQQEYQDAVSALADAQAQYIEAVDNAAGDPVSAAKEAAKAAQDKVNSLVAQGAQANDPKLVNAQTDLVNAQASVQSAQYQDSYDDIQFALNMGKITKTQAIVRLKAMESLYANNKKEYQDLETEIKSLQDGANQNLEFNIPKLFNLPTLYEARRVDQTGGLSPSGGDIGYQDNRNIALILNVNPTNSSQVIQAINDALGTTRSGTAIKRY